MAKKTLTISVPYEAISDPERGPGIQYAMKGLVIEVYEEAIIITGTAEPFRTKSELAALKMLLDIASHQQIGYCAMKKFYPTTHEWAL